MLFLFLIFTFCFFFSLANGLYCPPGSFIMPGETVCGYAIAQQQYYHNAVKECTARGAVVAKVQNMFENAYFAALIDQDFDDQAPYIGVEKQLNGQWTYSDGSPLTYTHWAPDEPSTMNLNAICAVIDPATNGAWRAAECTKGRPFFCTLPGNNAPCPYNWIYFEPTKACYYQPFFLYSDSVHWNLYNWTTAESKCQQMGAHLASIHSKVEDDFVYNLIISSVKTLTASSNTCSNQWTHIGYQGNGTLGTGSWTDGTPVDYFGGAPLTSPWIWLVANDPSCQYKQWGYAGNSNTFARYICKMPATFM